MKDNAECTFNLDFNWNFELFLEGWDLERNVFNLDLNVVEKAK